MILSRYMARRYLTSFLGVMAVMAGILLMLDMVEQLRRFAGDGVGVGAALRLAALRMPSSLYAVLPLVAMLATLAMFVALARSSELVVARAVGRSALGVVLAPALVALGLGALAVAVLNPLVAATARHYDASIARLGGTDTALLSLGRDGLWLRDASPAGQRVIRASQSSADATRLVDVTILGFGADNALAYRLDAAAVRLVPGAWDLTEAREWDLTAPNPALGARSHSSLLLPTTLTPEALRDSFAPPITIPIWDLPGFIAAMDTAGFAALEHRVWLQMELALPLMLMAMVLLGAGFTLGHIRAGRQGVMVLAALIAGFGAFFLRDFAQVLGENGQIPPALAAWSPPMIASLLAVAFILQMEEG
ncbi:MAG: LPS export ABC transporter permease LptG [Alkalilacustris sp.]